MLTRRSILWLALFIFTVLPSLYAEPKLNASLSTSRLSENETVLLILQIDWPKEEGSYGFGVPAPGFENLSLVRRGESQEFYAEDGKNWIRKTFELELKPLGPGDASVREFAITYVDPVTQRPGSFQVSAMQLKVSKTGKNFPLLPVTIGGGGVFAAGLIGVLLLRKKKPKAEVEIPLSEEEKKAQKIRTIFESGGASKENFHLIAAEFREFLAEHYKTGQPHATEDEIAASLKSQDLPFEEWQKIKDLLQRIQEAKYLPEQSAMGDYKYLQREILSFVESKKNLESITDRT